MASSSTINDQSEFTDNLIEEMNKHFGDRLKLELIKPEQEH